jgi:hypothetical protein
MLSKSTICYFVGPDNEHINVPVRTLNEKKDGKKSTKRRDKKIIRRRRRKMRRRKIIS